MPELPFPLSSTPGSRPGEGEGRLVNCHVSKEGDQIYLRRAPGLTADAIMGQTNPRGLVDVDGSIYAAYANASLGSPESPAGMMGTVIARRLPTGAVNLLTGKLSGSGVVTMARNSRLPSADIVGTREGGGPFRVKTTAQELAAYPDADLPPAVNSVSYLSGFFVFTDPEKGRIWASDLNTTDQSALSYASAESRPDALVRGMTVGGVFFAFGASSIEPWVNVGSSPFPLKRHTTVIPVGLLAFGAIAGSQEGWDREPLFVAHDNTVRALRGYDAAVVSTPDVQRFIERSTHSTLSASVYTARGQSFWVLSSDQGTWEYNLNLGSWTERQSDGATGWRARHSVKIGNTWFVQDTLSDRLLKIDGNAYMEHTSALPWTVESGGLKKYPARVAVPNAFFNFTRVAATAGVPNPLAEISWSHDGGGTWSTPVQRSLLTANRDPIRVNRLGMSTHHGLRARIKVSDAVDFSFMGAAVPEPQARAA